MSRDVSMKMVIGCVHGAHRTLTERFADYWAGPPSYDWCEAVYQAARPDAPPPGKDLPPWVTHLLHRAWVKANWYRCDICGGGCADFPVFEHAGSCFPARPEPEPEPGQLSLFDLAAAS
jgi:hypothetical protein